MRLPFASLALALMLMSCASSRNTPVSITGVDAIVIGPVLLKQTGNDSHVESLFSNSFVVVGRDASLAHVITAFDERLLKLWEVSIDGFSSDKIDRQGIHMSEGVLYVPITHWPTEDGGEFRMHSVNVASGSLLESRPIMRINRGDGSAGVDGFGSDATAPIQQGARSRWSPDSSKILVYKSFAASEDRMTIEMMLFKPGYSLITRDNVSFKFDKRAQELLGVLTDDDGVAYIYLHNKRDSSFEIGRYEVLGSKRLRTLTHSYAGGRVLKEGKIAVAPRGHAYITTLDTSDAASLLDFDFYSNSSRTKQFNVAEDIATINASIDQFFVAPKDDRIIVTYSARSPQRQTRVHAFNLELEQVWNKSRSDHSGTSIELLQSSYLHGSLEYLLLDDQTLRPRSIRLIDGSSSGDQKNLASIRNGDRLKSGTWSRINSGYTFERDGLWLIKLP